jgi:AraC-like DNA-binding protein
VIDQRLVLVTTGPGPAILPRLERIVWERGQPGAYVHDSGLRPTEQAAIQITLGGRGAVLGTDGTVRAEVPVGRALCFVSRRHRVRYGCCPGDHRPWEFLYANLEGAAAVEAVSDLVAAHGHSLPLDPAHATVAALVRMVPRAAVRHRRLGAGASARLAGDLVAALVDGCDPGGVDASLVEQAMAYLAARLAEPVGVAQAAAHCGVSREHLARTFLRRGSGSPAAWLRGERLRLAGILLRAGDDPVAEVARRCGFAGASHFIQAFRAYAGATPARYRRG